MVSLSSLFVFSQLRHQTFTLNIAHLRFPIRAADLAGVIDSEKDCAVDDNSAVVVAIGDVRFAITAVGGD
ncbi:hypothetical protein ACOSP7_024398 [Xanthoceras sorbifolium]